MRIWEQKTIYRHGFKFTIKRGSRYARTAGSKGRSVHLPEFVLSMEGKFLLPAERRTTASVDELLRAEGACRMTAYYNEIDPFAAQWLRELIKAGHIAPGDVDERSIVDVRPDDLRGYAQCHFFAGIGVWSHALRQAGWPDDRPVWTGSCPCQPFSAAGKGAGFDDERHLWPAFFHLISQCGPPVVAGEQVASKDGLGWLDLVQADMEGTGYAFGAVDTCAAGFGAPHIRQRLYWVADTESARGRGRAALANGEHEELGRPGKDVRAYAWPDGYGSGSALAVSDVCSPSYGSAARVGRLRGYGNAINAEQATAFIEAYLETEAGQRVRLTGAFA